MIAPLLVAACYEGIEDDVELETDRAALPPIYTQRVPYVDDTVPSGPHWNHDYRLGIPEEAADSPYFYSNQFGFAAGGGGYIGLQSGTQYGKLLIFSIWDSTTATPGPGAWCQTFGGEGVGMSCRMEYDWVEGRTYRLRVWRTGADAWSAYILDETTNVEQYLGTITAPAGSGDLSYNLHWIEWFGSAVGHCADMPYTMAYFHPTVANGGALAAASWNYHYHQTASCRNSYGWDAFGAHFLETGTRAHEKVALRAASGHYVVAEGGGGGAVNANRTAVGPWETFALVPRGGNAVALQSINGSYVSADAGGGGSVAANRSWQLGWETFTRVATGGGGLALRTQSGHYVVAEYGGNAWVAANRTGIGPWETFTVEPQ
ncbi:MAG: DUF3472 domain-containing protein [Deltaproteobacteria bacterium]|nr:DUF3472 domain-containing protein [Nannocystaceae bacterium]